MTTIAAPTDSTFEYTFSPINDLVVETRENPKTGKPEVKHVLVQDEPLKPSERFWTSLFARFGFNKAFFRYFDHAEVFDRISEVEAGDRMRLCIERGKDETTGRRFNRLLAVSNPAKPIVAYDELMEMLGSANTHTMSYGNGIIESTHSPRVGGTSFEVMGDTFKNRFMLATPIDGYGMPNVYLSLLRQICTNGIVGLAKAFRSGVSLGKGDDNVAFALTRVLDQFNNDEGYAAIRNRIESAAESWASVYETTALYKLLVKLHNNRDVALGGDGASMESPYVKRMLSNARDNNRVPEDGEIVSPVLTAFHEMTGDTTRLYGLANLDALSAKRQRTLPVKCKVLDAINFATEVATHYASTGGARLLNAWTGSLISGEYDMEGTAEHFTDFADFHISAKLEQGLTGSENSGE